MLDLERIGPISFTEYTRLKFIDEVLTDRLAAHVNSLCDVGCGTGMLLSALDLKGVSAKGIDASPESLTVARQRLQGSSVVLETLDMGSLDGAYDLIILTSVLEHIADDYACLAALKGRALNKEGHVIITVPAHSRLFSRFDAQMGHMRRYDRDGLISLVQKSGLRPVCIWSYGSILSHVGANRMHGAVTAAHDMDERTRLSALREYRGIARSLFARANVAHSLFYLYDRMTRAWDRGIEYFVLAQAVR